MTVLDWLFVAVPFWFAVSFAWTTAAARRPQGKVDRCALLSGLAMAAVGLAFGRALGPWDTVPPALWGVAVAITAWGVLTAIQVWPRVPAVRGTRHRLRLASTGLGLVFSAALVALLI